MLPPAALWRQLTQLRRHRISHLRARFGGKDIGTLTHAGRNLQLTKGTMGGLKNTDTDIGFVTGAFARLGRDFRIFAGLELPTLPMLGIGGCGMMITASNVAPGMVSQMYDTFAKGDLDGAIALNLKLYPLFRGVALESSPIPVKYMLKRFGVLKTNEHRSPMVPASPEIEKQLDKILAEVGLI
jgi:4-hydroxy-tetrahydrodipicolinate synthase